MFVSAVKNYQEVSEKQSFKSLDFRIKNPKTKQRAIKTIQKKFDIVSLKDLLESEGYSYRNFYYIGNRFSPVQKEQLLCGGKNKYLTEKEFSKLINLESESQLAFFETLKGFVENPKKVTKRVFEDMINPFFKAQNKAKKANHSVERHQKKIEQAFDL